VRLTPEQAVPLKAGSYMLHPARALPEDSQPEVARARCPQQLPLHLHNDVFFGS